jgi:thioredoxin 2
MATEQQTKKATVMCQSCETLNRVDLGRAGEQPKCGECGKPIPLDRPIKVTDQSMEQTLKGTDVPVVVDFYADWCQPCKMMAPLLDTLAADMAGELLVAKLDTDSNPTMAVHYGIRGIPTLIVFKEGREWKRQTGVVPPDKLAEMLEIDVDVEED